MMNLNEALQCAFGAGLLRSAPVSGGDINDAFALTLTDGRRVFMKANRSASPAFFQAEADGLKAMRDTAAIGVPGVIAIGTDAAIGAFLLLEWVEGAPRVRDFWEDFGHSLAAMHDAPAPCRFGWTHDNYIGSGAQINALHDSWIAFFRD